MGISSEDDEQQQTKKPAAAKPQTPEQRKQAESRVKEDEIKRAFYEKLINEMTWVRADLRQDEYTEEQKQANAQAATYNEVNAGVLEGTPTSKKMTDGPYRVTYIDEYPTWSKNIRDKVKKQQKPGDVEKEFTQEAEFQTAAALKQVGKLQRALHFMGRKAGDVKKHFRNIEPKTFMVMVKDGNISPVFNYEQDRDDSYYTNKRKFKNIWTQVMRLYGAALGSNRLSLNFPNAAKFPDKLDLKNVERLMNIALKEGYSLSIGPQLEEALVKISAKGGKKAIQVEVIRRLSAETTNKMLSNPDIRKVDEKIEYMRNKDGLQSETSDLKQKAEGLAKVAKAEEATPKIAEINGQIQKVDARLAKVQEDVEKFGAGPETCKNYEAAVRDAEKTIAEARAALNNAAIKADPTALSELKSAMDKLKKKAEDVRVLGVRNKMDSVERAQVKTEELRANGRALDAKLAEVNAATTPADKVKKLDELKQSLKEMNGMLADMQAEPRKPDAAKQRDQYKLAVQDANAQLTRLNAAITEMKGATGQDPTVSAKLEEFSVLQKDLQRKVDNMTTSFENLSLEAASKKDLDQDLADIRNVDTIEEALDKIDDQAERVTDEGGRLSEEIQELNRQIEACESMPDPEKKEKLEKLELEQEELQVRHDALQKRNTEFSKLAGQLEQNQSLNAGQRNDLTGMNRAFEEVRTTVLAKQQTKLAENKEKLNAMKPEEQNRLIR